MMRRLGKGRFGLLRGQRGFSLIEIVVAVALLASIGVIFQTSMGNAYKNVGMLGEKTQAEALARSQLEQIKSLSYQDSGNYAVTVSLPLQYSMSINVTSPKQIGTSDNYTSLEQLMGGPVSTIQEITVFVFRPAGAGNKLVFSLAAYRSKVQ